MTQQAEQRQRQIEENLGLVHACANRLLGRSASYEDLVGAGCVGLVKAADGFDPSLGYAFSTYAVPVILGEMRRLLREESALKVSRSAREKAARLCEIQKQLRSHDGREPTIGQIAEKAGMESSEAAALLFASLPALPLVTEYDGEERPMEIPCESGEQPILEKLSLEKAMTLLPEKDRLLIECRYFHAMTQTATAEKLGMSQVQVSRREKAILRTLRGYLSE